MRTGEGRGTRRRTRGDEGEGPVSYLLVVLLIVAIVSALVASSYGGTVSSYIVAAVCKVGENTGLDKCKDQRPPKPPVQVTDPDKPTGQCLVSLETEYLEFTASANIRLFQIITDGGGQLTLRHYRNPDGTEEWQVWDNGWTDAGAGVGVPAKYKNKGLNAGAWLTVVGDHTNIYSFKNEAEARKFYNDLKDYRIGNWLKLAVRTNPVSGGLNWLLTKVPGIGDDIDKFMGGKEPDRDPSQEYWGAGLLNGFYNNLSLGGLPLSVVGKNFGWTSGGVWTNHQTGEKTYFFQGSQQLMESLALDVSGILKKLKLPATSANIQKAINQLEKELSTKAGTPVSLPPVLRNGLAAQIGLGVGLRGTVARFYAITYDKNGKPVSLQVIEDFQGSWHLRGELGAGPLEAWMNDSQGGTRWRTVKTLDLTKPDDAAATVKFLRQMGYNAVGAFLELDNYFNNGGGTMGRTHYDYHVNTKHPGLNLGIGTLEYEDEKAESFITQGEYYKPGKGWVKWDTCGAG